MIEVALLHFLLRLTLVTERALVQIGLGQQYFPLFLADLDHLMVISMFMFACSCSILLCS